MDDGHVFFFAVLYVRKLVNVKKKYSLLSQIFLLALISLSTSCLVCHVVCVS